MINKLYYFSGRGNSLKTALEVSKRLENPVLAPVRHGTEADLTADTDSVGIFTPVIDLGTPAYVLSFIDRMKAENKNTYLYAVVTNGGLPGAAAEQIRKHLKKKGLALSADFLMTFGLGWSASEEWLEQIDRIAETVRNKQARRSTLKWKDRALTLANPLAKLMIPSEDKKFALDEKCTGCGTCAKICPVKNIRLTDGKPVWLHACEQCAVCFSWCPKEAIGGTNLAARTRYTNLNITLSQMLGRPEA